MLNFDTFLGSPLRPSFGGVTEAIRTYDSFDSSRIIRQPLSDSEMDAAQVKEWLKNKLGSQTDELWSDADVGMQLSAQRMKAICDCFPTLPTNVKIRLLLSLARLSPAKQDELRNEIQTVAQIAQSDHVSWVSTMARVMQPYLSQQTILDTTVVEHELIRPVRNDLRAAVQQAYVSNAGGGSGKNSTPAALLQHQQIVVPPFEALYINKKAFIATFADMKQPVNHFQLKQKPKSATLKHDLMQKATQLKKTQQQQQQFSQQQQLTADAAHVTANSYFAGGTGASLLTAAAAAVNSGADSILLSHRYSSSKVAAGDAEPPPPLLDGMGNEHGSGFLRHPSSSSRPSLGATPSSTSTTTTSTQRDSRVRQLDFSELPSAVGKRGRASMMVSTKRLNSIDALANAEHADSGVGTAAGEGGAVRDTASPDSLHTTSSGSMSPAKSIPSTSSHAGAASPPKARKQHRKRSIQQQQDAAAASSRATAAPYAIEATRTAADVEGPPVLEAQEQRSYAAQLPPLNEYSNPNYSYMQTAPNAAVPAAFHAQPQSATHAPDVVAAQQHSMQPPANVPTQVDMQPPTPVAASSTATRINITPEMKRFIKDLFASANRITRPEQALIVSFLSGHRNNPFPQLGHIITVRLSETEAADDEGRPCIQEERFTMNFESGEWKRTRHKMPRHHQ